MTITARPWLDRIQAYSPGRHAANPDGSMASNESPLGPSPSVISAITQAAKGVHHYPSPLADELRSELATLHGVDADQIIVGNGSDELIFLLASAYLAQGGHAVCADPAYSIDLISTHLVDARMTQVPLVNWAHDLEAMSELDADIAYVVNPHNPTGSVRSLVDIARFIERSPAKLIVVDEAYIEFTDDPEGQTAIPLVGDTVAVLRTFSKIHGLAGLRVGYLVASKDVISVLRRIRAPFSVGCLAQAAAVAALRDPAHRDAVRDHTRRARTELTGLFQAAGYDVVPSQANFVLVKAPDEMRLVNLLFEHGVSVRPGSALGLPGTIRVSVPNERGLRLITAALSAETLITA